MHQERLSAQKRGAFGKGEARALRREGKLPAILYGQGKNVLPLQVEEHTFRQFLRSHGENVLINLDIPDHGTETAILKDLQRDSALKRVMLHADFLRIALDEPITANITITLVGDAPGVEEGGVLEFPLRELQVNCLPTLLPEGIEVDVSGLDINDIIHVSDLSLAEGIEVLDDPQTMVAAVSPPRIEEEVAAEEGVEGEEAETEGEETPEEPELISRRRDDDDES